MASFLPDNNDYYYYIQKLIAIFNTNNLQFMKSTLKYTVDISFEEIKLPPFEEMLVLGKNSPHGKQGISKSFDLLIPNGFEIIDTKHDNVDCVFVNKRILAKMPKEKILKILEANVFPYVSDGEIIKLDFKVKISYKLVDENDSE